jgi:hypothetical protein
VTGPQREALDSVHAEIAAEAGLPSLEGPYVTFSDLAASPERTPDGPFWHDGVLTAGLQGRNPVEWLTLARYGIVVRGPDPAVLGAYPGLVGKAFLGQPPLAAQLL